jgi:hypothetical protein
MMQLHEISALVGACTYKPGWTILFAIDGDGRFVDRREARIIAQAANTVHEPQVRQKTPDKNSL